MLPDLPATLTFRANKPCCDGLFSRKNHYPLQINVPKWLLQKFMAKTVCCLQWPANMSVPC